MREDIEKRIKIPEGVGASVDSKYTLKVSGPEGELKRTFSWELKVEGNEIVLSSKKSTKRQKKILNTTTAHIKNMLNGVVHGYNYSLQICSVHFPMTVTVEKSEVIIKNFLGESKERRAKVLPNVRAKLENDFIKIHSADKEAAGQTAANIEITTRVKGKDRRVFQDGIWIVEKPGREF